MRSKTEWKAQGVLAGSALLLATMVAAAASGGGTTKAPSKAPAPAAAEAGTAGLHVTVFETTLPAGRIADVNAQALQAKAGTTAGLKAALGELGETKILYHAYQLAGLAGDSRIQLGTRRPFVVNTRMLEVGPRTMVRPRPSGNTPVLDAPRPPASVRTTDDPRPPGVPSPRGISRINTVQYENTGMIFELAIEPKGGGPKGVLHTRMSLELSALADSSVEIAGDVKAIAIRQVEMNQTGEMRIGQPIITIHVDGASPEKGAAATAYVCRVLLSESP